MQDNYNKERVTMAKSPLPLPYVARLGGKTQARIATDYIEMLLEKDDLSGEECGKVLMYDFVNGTNRAENTEEDYQRWYAINKKLYDVVPKLSISEFSIYSYFVSLHSWMARTSPEASGHYRRCFAEYFYLHETADKISEAESIYPLVMRLLKTSPEQKSWNLAHCLLLPKQRVTRPYTAPTTTFRRLTLDRYNNEFFDDAVDLKQHYIMHKKSLEQSYYYLQGYNMAIEMIGNHIEINEFTALKFDVVVFEEFNNCYDSLSNSVNKNSTLLSQNEKESKQKTIDAIFTKIDFKNLQPSKENILKAKKILDKGSAFDGGYEFINLLTKR